MTEIPDHIRVLKNGAWYDNDKKHIVAGGTLHPEIAREMSNKRHEVAREMAALGLRRAVESQGMRVASPEHAWGSVIEAQSLLAIDIDAAHASTQAAKLVGQASGMLATDKTTIQDQRKQTVVIVGGEQAGKYLEDLGIGQLDAHGADADSIEAGVDEGEGDDYAQSGE